MTKVAPYRHAVGALTTSLGKAIVIPFQSLITLSEKVPFQLQFTSRFKTGHDYISDYI